jgi:hypothetical protein
MFFSDLLKFNSFLAITLAWPITCSAAEVSLPTGWRVPTQAETSHNQEWRNRDKNRFLTIEADFNGDGVPDRAMLLVRDKDSTLGLFAFVSQASNVFKTYILDEAIEKVRLDVMGITVSKPGKYTTACGKGYLDCREGEPEIIALQIAAVNYFKEGSANSFFYWDKVGRNFKRSWMSD